MDTVDAYLTQLLGLVNPICIELFLFPLISGLLTKNILYYPKAPLCDQDTGLDTLPVPVEDNYLNVEKLLVKQYYTDTKDNKTIACQFLALKR